MKEIALNDAPYIHPVVAPLAIGLHASGPRDAAAAFHQWIRNNMVFIDEAEEMVKSPLALITGLQRGETMFGDCDDASALLASMLASVGIPARFRAVAPRGGDDFLHVFVEFRDDEGLWIPVDPTITHAPVFDGESLLVEL